MRTTLTIDDDVLAAAKERARRENRTAGAVLSDLARQALSGPSSEPAEADADEVYGFAPFPRSGSVVTNSLIDRIREDEGV